MISTSPSRTLRALNSCPFRGAGGAWARLVSGRPGHGTR